MWLDKDIGFVHVTCTQVSFENDERLLNYEVMLKFCEEAGDNAKGITRVFEKTDMLIK